MREEQQIGLLWIEGNKGLSLSLLIQFFLFIEMSEV